MFALDDTFHMRHHTITCFSSTVYSVFNLSGACTCTYIITTSAFTGYSGMGFFKKDSHHLRSHSVGIHAAVGQWEDGYLPG